MSEPAHVCCFRWFDSRGDVADVRALHVCALPSGHHVDHCCTCRAMKPVDEGAPYRHEPSA